MPLVRDENALTANSDLLFPVVCRWGPKCELKVSLTAWWAAEGAFVHVNSVAAALADGVGKVPVHRNDVGYRSPKLLDHPATFDLPHDVYDQLR